MTGRGGRTLGHPLSSLVQMDEQPGTDSCSDTIHDDVADRWCSARHQPLVDLVDDTEHCGQREGEARRTAGALPARGGERYRPQESEPGVQR